METTYILFKADFDEGESEVVKLYSVGELYDFFDGEEGIVLELLKDGVYYGEWWNYHLVKLEDNN